MAAINPLLYPVLKFLASFLIRKQHIPKSPLSELGIDAEKPIIYALNTADSVDLVTLQNACIRSKMPNPLEPLVINGMTIPRCISITPTSESLAVFSQLLKSHENNPELDVQLLPVKLFWDRYPGKEGQFRKKHNYPSFIKQCWKLFIKGRESLVRFSQPVSLQYMAKHHGTDDKIAQKLVRIAKIHFSRQKMAATGPQLPDRDQMFESLLASPALRKALGDEVKSKKCSESKAQETALSYLNEIATDFSYRYLRITERLLTWIWNRIYKGIEVNNSETIRRLAEEGHEIVYAPSHRSHMDYLLLSYVLYHQGMVPPHIAAGVNLDFWPAGPIFRKTGAFFIRRSFRGNKLYATVFREYLATLFSKGYAVEYFTEGGRTRTGRLLAPKTGMVSMTVQAMLRGLDRPVTIVPVYFGYENVMEVATYYKELKGAKKEKESFWQVLGIFKKLRNFGHGYVNFGEPIQVNQYLDKMVPQWKDDIDPIEVQKPAWMAPAVNGLANELMTRINSAAATNALALTATVLLASDNNALSRQKLEKQLAFILAMFEQAPYSALSTKPDCDAQTLLNNALELKKFEINNDGLGEVISLDTQQAILLTFYRNNIQHLFALPSVVASILLRQDEIKFEQVIEQISQIYPLLKSELFLQFTQDELELYIDKLVKYFIAVGTIIETATGLTINAEHTGKFELLSQIMQDTIQRYGCVLSLLRQQPDLSRRELEKDSKALAKRIASVHGSSAPELMDKSVFSALINDLKKLDYLSDSGCSDELLTLESLIMSLLDSKTQDTIKEVTRK